MKTPSKYHKLTTSLSIKFIQQDMLEDIAIYKLNCKNREKQNFEMHAKKIKIKPCKKINKLLSKINQHFPNKVIGQQRH